MPIKRPRCVIIGAGLAGLSAGLRLSSRGWHVDVLEAWPDIGGRVYSHSFSQAPNLVCELGGEWIGDDHHRMQEHCRRLGLRLQKHQYSFSFPGRSASTKTYRPGAFPFSRKDRRAFARFGKEFRRFSIAQNKELDQYDWWTWLRNLGFSREALLRRDLMDSTDFGESIRLSSAFMAAGEYYDGNKTDEMDWKIVGGNKKLPLTMANRIRRSNPSAIHPNCRVIEIRQTNDEVAVHTIPNARTKQGSRSVPRVYKADFVICTVPARSLNKIRWFPELPEEKARAANELQYSRIMKTQVLCPERFWPKPSDGGFSLFTEGVSDFCFESTQGQRGQQGILCSYAIGDKADDLAAESSGSLMKWIVDDVLRAVGRTPGSITGIDIKRQPWQADPHTQGAYAFYRPGQWFSVRPALAAPHLRVHFAGEHLDEDWQGFMEGAVRSGEGAADQI